MAEDDLDIYTVTENGTERQYQLTAKQAKELGATKAKTPQNKAVTPENKKG
jgi:hypothetical protein